MFKLASNLGKKLIAQQSPSVQIVRELKTKGEYFRRFGYEYNTIYKGGNFRM